MRRPTTIKDIAKEMDVSIATVSRALSGKPGVSDELREKIQIKAEELGYLRNSAAISLKTSKTKTIGVIVSDIRNPFFLDFLTGVDNVLFSRGYKFLLSNSDESVEKEKIYLNWMVEHGVEGILASPVSEKDGKSNISLYRKFYKLGIPIVLYDRTFPKETQFDSVTIDNKDSIIQALIYLKNKGHEKIGIFLSKSGIYTIEERLKGFIEGCKLLNLPFKEEWIGRDLYPEEMTYNKLKELLDKNNLPTAIIATNNKITKLLVSASRKLNINIPKDLSIMGYDDLPENEIISPPITCIKQPVFEIGRIASTVLLGKINDNFSEPTKVILKAEIIERKSIQDLNKKVSHFINT